MPAIYCRRCEKLIKEGREVWLELDQRTGTYTDDGTVPEQFSQGEFPFGADCARQELKRRDAIQPQE